VRAFGDVGNDPLITTTIANGAVRALCFWLKEATYETSGKCIEDGGGHTFRRQCDGPDEARLLRPVDE